MKTLYLDCGMGAAGDMLTAALLELFPDQDAIIKELNDIGIPGVVIKKEKSAKCGITGTHISVMINGVEKADEHCHDHDHAHHHSEHEHHHHEHHHRSMNDISKIINALRMPENAKEKTLSVYSLIAEAESHAHNVPVTDIHFHEVGTMDAIADIASVCFLMERLSPEQVIVSPVHVGSGKVRCAHGVLPVPAPATAYILRDVPIYGGKLQGELCTPTGAALLKTFATGFGDMPVMRVSSIGYGMGKKDFESANCLRAMLGETEGKTDTVCVLSCNIDDMTAEALGFAMEMLFDAGALEVFTVPAGMKKSRPGVLLNVICGNENRENIVRTIFMHTTTIGIRETQSNRFVLERDTKTFETPYGTVRQKHSSGYGATKRKYEYEDISRIAKERGLSLSETEKQISEAMD